MLPPVGIGRLPFRYNMLLSDLTWHLLVSLRRKDSFNPDLLLLTKLLKSKNQRSKDPLCFLEVKPVMSILPFLPILYLCENKVANFQTCDIQMKGPFD